MAENAGHTQAAPLSLGVQGEVWLQQGARALGGRTRVELLAAIGRAGSITSAAREVGISYKTAWETIDTMNNLAGEPLVERTTGGRGGGGTRLTARAERLIATFERVTEEHQRFLARLGAAIEHFDTDWELIGRLAMKTSARNQLHGTINNIIQGAVNDQVSIMLPGGATVVAVITRASTESLGLREGMSAFALIKASSVILMCLEPSDAGVKLSARNQLAGQVVEIKDGAVNAEVVVELPGGERIAAIITRESLATLALREGAPVVALFKASSVIVGV